MSEDEIAKEIVIALINNNFFSNIESVCEAYKKIAKTITNPNG